MQDYTSNPLSPGQRIVKLRRITRLSRRAFGEKHGISPGTLQNWEMDRYQTLTKKAVADLITAFQREGINCSVEWLLHGTGSQPSHHSLNTLIPTDKNPLDELVVSQTKKNAEQIKLNEELYQATKAGRFSVVESLLKKGADLHLHEGIAIHHYNNDEDTPLHVSSYNGHLNIVKLLIEKGSDVNFRNRRKQTPLHLAIFNGHSDVIEYLISKGADIDAPENEGSNPASWAAYTGQIKILEILMKLGANIHGKDHANNTCLHWAAYKGHTDIVELLVNLSADPNEKNSRGETPLDCAVSTGKIETVLFLLKYRKAGNE